MAVSVDDLSAQGAGSQQRFVVLGCLSRDAPPARGGKPVPPVYTIRDPRGEGMTYRIEGNDEELRLHVGHTVEISGSLSPVPATATNAAVRTLKMSSLTYLSTTCIYK